MNNVMHEAIPPEQPMLDAAFALATQAVGPLGHAHAKRRLAEMFEAATPGTLHALYLRALGLLERCYEAGDAIRNAVSTTDEAADMLRQRCPGFSPEAYRSAVAWGLYVSR